MARLNIDGEIDEYILRGDMLESPRTFREVEMSDLSGTLLHSGTNDAIWDTGP